MARDEENPYGKNISRIMSLPQCGLWVTSEMGCLLTGQTRAPEVL